MLRKYRIDFSYFGQDFHGWQSQVTGRGVQDLVNHALSTFLRHEVRVNGASRTDSGVHAEHQVAVFRSSVPFDPLKWLRSINGILPSSIVAYKIIEADEEFHPIRSVRSKIYRYRIWNHPIRNPLLESRAWHRHGFEFEEYKDLMNQFIGTHDFKSFCAADGGAKTHDRTIHDIKTIHRGSGLIDSYILGNGFLKQMVRNIVGTSVDIAQGALTSDIDSIFQACDRKAAGMTAPARGLSLVKLFYHDAPPSLEPFSDLHEGASWLF